MSEYDFSFAVETSLPYWYLTFIASPLGTSSVMTEITIEYCVPCGLLDSAIDTERALLEEFGQDIDEVRLQPGHGGVFKIHADGETVFDKDENGAELVLPEIKDAVRDRNQTAA